MRPALAGAAVVLALLTAGCSASAGTPTVSSEELETQVVAMLEEQVGQTPDDLDCPDALPAEEGAEVRCTLTAGDSAIGVTVTATSVEGEDVTLGIQVDDEALAEGEEA
jgi:outer membrane murein-binding lipoprotein Lpp